MDPSYSSLYPRSFALLGHFRAKEPVFKESASDNGYVLSDFVKNVLKDSGSACKTKYTRSVDRFGKVHYQLARVPAGLDKMCMDFLAWINDRRNKFIQLKGHWLNSGDSADVTLPYTHRWCDEYRNRVLAKLYYVMEFLGGKDCSAFMLTLTVPHRGISPIECLTRLKSAQKKLTRILRRWHYIDRVWFLDSHPKTGYPHTHMLVMGEIPAWRISKLKFEWAVMMGCTTRTYDSIRKHGLHVKILNSAADENEYKRGKVHNLVSYMMKYLSKSFGFTGKSDIPAHLLVFNSTLWAWRANPESHSKCGARLFGMSREMSLYASRRMREYVESLKRGRVASDTWVFDGLTNIVDEDGNVISSVDNRRPSIEVVRDEFLFSIPSESYGHPLLHRVWRREAAGVRVVDRDGDVLRVYSCHPRIA